MKLKNYDPGSSKSDYVQGHPCFPDDFFCMLICGPSNSGKTNILMDVTKTGNREWGMGNGEWGMGNDIVDAKATDSFRDRNLSANYSCGLLRLRLESDLSQNNKHSRNNFRRSWFTCNGFHCNTRSDCTQSDTNLFIPTCR